MISKENTRKIKKKYNDKKIQIQKNTKIKKSIIKGSAVQ